MSSPDSFAERFDSIEIGRDSACSPAAFEQALAIAQPPGFTMIDDADGRFVVDPEFGFVSVASDEVLARDMGSVHAVALRVVEQSGESYRLDLQLRITGRVPQMIGAEEFAAIAGLTDETILVAPRVPLLIVPEEKPKAPVEIAPMNWTRFAVAQGHQSRTPRQQPRRSFIVADIPPTNERVSFEFDGLPRPFSAHLPWSL